MIDENYSNAVASLGFFCFSGELQVLSLNEVGEEVPHFFFKDGNNDRDDNNYFFGIACVFIGHVNYLYNEFLSSDEATCLSDFHHRLNVYMQESPDDWTAQAVLESKKWESLRIDARKALSEIGEILPSRPPKFKISELISPDDFRTTEEARKWLDSI